MAIYPDGYRVRWMPLRIAPDTLDADTLNMTLTLRNDPTNLPFDPHKPRPQPQKDPPPPSDEDTVAASPTWLFSLVAETNGWLAAPPGPTVSRVSSLPMDPRVSVVVEVATNLARINLIGCTHKAAGSALALLTLLPHRRVSLPTTGDHTYGGAGSCQARVHARTGSMGRSRQLPARSADQIPEGGGGPHQPTSRPTEGVHVETSSTRIKTQ